MSGFQEISSWALDNLPIELEDDFEAWKAQISGDFEANGRLPLDEIFDANDFTNLEDVFDLEHAALVEAAQKEEEEESIESGMEALFG